MCFETWNDSGRCYELRDSVRRRIYRSIAKSALFSNTDIAGARDELVVIVDVGGDETMSLGLGRLA
jgi:hypothetical protein